MSWSSEDEQFMHAALAEAKVAGQADEVPVGAVVVRNGEIIGRVAIQRRMLKSSPFVRQQQVKKTTASMTPRST